ncbi:MAG: hypothetical protein WBV94_28845 [Blastocatellia bacterium]
MNYPDAKLIPLLIKELHSETDYNQVLEAVASLLVQLGKGNDHVIAAVAELLTSNSRGSARFYAVSVLAQLGAPAISVLCQALKDGIETSAVIEALGQIGGKAIDCLVETLKTTDSAGSGVRIIDALSHAGERGLLTLIEAVVHHKDKILRGEAAMALALGDFEASRDQVIEVLNQALADRDSIVRHAGACAMEILGHPHLISFNGNPEIKDAFLARVKADEDAGELVQDNALEDEDLAGKAVECNWNRGLSYLKLEAYEIGISRQLAETAYIIFEALPDHHSTSWAMNFLEAIPVGVNLDFVERKFLHWLLVDEVDGVIRFANTDYLREVIQRVANLYNMRIEGEIIGRNVWRAASEAAASAGHAAYDFEAHPLGVSEADAPDAAAACAAFVAEAVAFVAAYLNEHLIRTALDQAARAAAYADADPTNRAVRCRIRQAEKLLEVVSTA